MKTLLPKKKKTYTLHPKYNHFVSHDTSIFKELEIILALHLSLHQPINNTYLICYYWLICKIDFHCLGTINHRVI
jgi:hypothetical protein